MAATKAAAVVLAAGKGTRMKSALPKVMHAIAGRPMIGHVLASLEPLGTSPVVVVVAPGMKNVTEAVAPHATAIQESQLGTGHAVLAANKFVRIASAPFLIEGHSARLDINVGIALFPDHGKTSGTLLQAADLALYEAKRSGRDCLVVSGQSTAGADAGSHGVVVALPRMA